ncbi:hypothetical protein MVES1_000749 [Malassezia vespertilionis]|nr:uncharacterized protein MVES1_000749 [Malassezia vespertilionis]WFD05419.1 hypothetical protein MVES1_000749 [Malassezia vespertilionis]
MLPQKSEQQQEGTNACGTGDNPNSDCQNVYFNSAKDFCLWAPSGPETVGIGEAERHVVSYCTKSGRGTRLIPPGTLKSVHYVRTPHYVQVSGTGNFANMHISAQGGGGELDPHGQDGLGNPIGGLVFSTAFGRGFEQVHEWMSFMDDKTYCFRACMDSDLAYEYCKNTYDELGCNFNMPTGPDQPDVFESCEGADADVVGLYTDNGVVSTFLQSQTLLPGIKVPPPKAPQPINKCSPFQSTKLHGSLKQPFRNVTWNNPLIKSNLSKSNLKSSSKSKSSTSTTSSTTSQATSQAPTSVTPAATVKNKPTSTGFPSLSMADHAANLWAPDVRSVFLAAFALVGTLLL